MGVCERVVNERPRSAETPPKAKATEIMARLYKTMFANACRRFRSRIGRVMEAGGKFMGYSWMQIYQGTRVQNFRSIHSLS